MVAEIIAIQTVLERKKKVIFILPFVSVVREKMLYFQVSIQVLYYMLVLKMFKLVLKT